MAAVLREKSQVFLSKMRKLWWVRVWKRDEAKNTWMNYRHLKFLHFSLSKMAQGDSVWWHKLIILSGYCSIKILRCETSNFSHRSKSAKYPRLTFNRKLRKLWDALKLCWLRNGKQKFSLASAFSFINIALLATLLL